MGENATPDESVQIVFDGDTVADTDNPLPVAVVSGGSGGGPATIADGADATQGAKADAAWNGTPGSTTVMAVLKAIYAKVAATLGFSVNAGTTDATTLRVITASDGPLNTNLGTTTDAAVTTDANGSVSSKIRGLVKLWNSVIGSAGSSATGVVSVQGIASGTAAPVSLRPATAGGSTPYRNLDLGVTGQVVKNGAGQLYNFAFYNNGSSVRFVKVYDKGTAPTQADTPVFTIAVPAGSGSNLAMPNGIAFAAGISLRASTGVADSDTGAPTTNDVIVNLGYT